MGEVHAKMKREIGSRREHPTEKTTVLVSDAGKTEDGPLTHKRETGLGGSLSVAFLDFTLIVNLLERATDNSDEEDTDKNSELQQRANK